jgi:7,8-dihydropterin-6-yl-methyl-4-(beta-D-ribofuranosyl)aminobenzene 5'-phosphate synthase
MKVTSLIENQNSAERPELQAEFGLSLHVEHNGTRILFDTGTSGAFARNAGPLGIDLQAVDLAVLSHHHFDHGGGLAAFLEQNSSAVVYLKRPPGGAPHARVLGLISKYVGIDHALLERHADRFAFVDRFGEVAPGVFVIPDIDRTFPLPEGNRFLYLKTNEGWQRDRFEHELVLAVKDADGMVIFTGCSHSGILNMIKTVEDRFPGVPIKAVVGGFHLIGMSPFKFRPSRKRRITDLGQDLLAYPKARYFTGHCTGQKGFRVLKEVMAERLEPINTGAVLSL